MDILSIIAIALTALFAVIGIMAGAVKGFTRVKSWAVELALTGLISIPVSRLIGKINQTAAAVITLGVTVGLLCLLMFLFKLFRYLLNRRIEKRKKLMYYMQYDEIEDNTEQILNAIGTEDKKQYKKLTKKKFKQSGGAWSVVDRIFGSAVLAIKGAAIAGFICVFAIVVLDFTRLPAEGGKLYDMLGGLYSGGTWQFFKNYVFDFVVIAVLAVCIKSGYASGISTALWSLFVIGLVVGSAVLSFSLAFNNPDFIAAAQKFEVSLSEKLSGISGVLETVGLSSLTIAKAILGLVMFVLLLVAVILISVFVPKLIDKARDGVVFRNIDGVFGAVVLTLLITALLLVVGAVANSMSGAKFMDVFNNYFDKSGIATYFYNKNLLNSFGLFTDLPTKKWFA